MDWKHIFIITFIYLIVAFCWRKYSKGKPIKHIFIINTFIFLIGAIIVYFYIAKFPTLKQSVDGVLSNTFLFVAVAGFILQNAVKNLVTGMLLVQSNAFKLGDRVSLRSRDLTGNIEEMTLRHTILRTYTNERVIVPNSILNDEVLINNHLKERSNSYPVIFPFNQDVDLEEAKKIIYEVIINNKDITNDKIEILCSDITKDGILLKTFIWTKDIEGNFRVASDIRIEVIKKLKEKNINLKI